jgi:hypothetical protein
VAAGGTVTVITDITELKHAEQDVAEKEAQLHVAMDNMPGALAYPRSVECFQQSLQLRLNVLIKTK